MTNNLSGLPEDSLADAPEDMCRCQEAQTGELGQVVEHIDDLSCPPWKGKSQGRGEFDGSSFSAVGSPPFSFHLLLLFIFLRPRHSLGGWCETGSLI